jgi:hypothetical protein
MDEQHYGNGGEFLLIGMMNLNKKKDVLSGVLGLVSKQNHKRTDFFLFYTIF